MKNKKWFLIIFQALFIGGINAQSAPTEAEIKFQNAWISNISNTSSDEDILIAAMFSEQNQPAAVPELLSREFASAEHNRMRLSIAYYYCQDNKGTGFCATDAIAEKLIRIDSDNVEPYLYLMVNLLDAGQEQEALAALINGNHANAANTYYLDKVNIVRNRLVDTGYPEGRINGAGDSVTGALSTYFFYVKLLAVCTEKSRDDIEWKKQCLERGKKLETVGNTIVQNVHGFAIQRDTLGTSAAETVIKADIVERMAAYNQIRDEGNARLVWWSDATLRPELVYNDTNEFGEMEAIKRALSRLE